MQVTTKYTATNTALQVIDVFDPPKSKTVYYEIHANDRNDSSVSTVVVNTNGIETSETQTAVSISGSRPAEILTDISNNVGRVLVTPLIAPTEYSITKTVIECQYYSENTVSGKLIKASEGFGISFAGSNNMTVRQLNNNIFGNANTFVVANTLGPVVTKTEFYSNNAFKSYNDSTFDYSNNIVITSSGQPYNNHYIEMDTVPGTLYRVSSNAYYTFDTVYGNAPTFDIVSQICVGTSIGDRDIDYVQLTESASEYTIDFIAQTDKVYVGFGFGLLGSAVVAEYISIKELVPFHTYNQLEGSFYLKWNAITAGSDVAISGNNRIFVDSSNNIFVNSVNCGSQSATNKLAFVYSSDGITYSLNNSVPVTNTYTYYGNTTQFVFQTNLLEFSYTPAKLSNTIITGLTNG